MSHKPDDLTAPQGGKSNRNRKKTYIDPNTLPLKEGDVLKLNPEYTVAETEWKDVEGNCYTQEEISAAQLLIARKYKIVVEHQLAVIMANGTDAQCREAIARVKKNYVDKLLEEWDIVVEDIELAARQHADIYSNSKDIRVENTLPIKYAKYIAFKHGVLWLCKKKK
jgi:hypothetical protein